MVLRRAVNDRACQVETVLQTCMYMAMSTPRASHARNAATRVHAATHEQRSCEPDSCRRAASRGVLHRVSIATVHSGGPCSHCRHRILQNALVTCVSACASTPKRLNLTAFVIAQQLPEPADWLHNAHGLLAPPAPRRRPLETSFARPGFPQRTAQCSPGTSVPNGGFTRCFLIVRDNFRDYQLFSNRQGQLFSNRSGTIVFKSSGTRRLFPSRWLA